MMNIETWKSLSKQDQDGWDTVSDDGKRKILEYAKTCCTPSEDPQRRIVNTHEFDDSGPSVIEADVHKISSTHEDSIGMKGVNLLHLTTNKIESLTKPRFTVNKMMSSSQK